jgi:hypothetical protein
VRRCATRAPLLVRYEDDALEAEWPKRIVCFFSDD